MMKFLPATILLIALAAMLAGPGPAFAQEEKGAPKAAEAETTGTQVKIVTAGAEAPCADEDLPPPEPDKQIRKMEVLFPIFGMLVPITLFVAIAVVIVVAILLAHKTALKRYEVIQLAIKEGKDLPPELFRNGLHRRRRDPLLGGLVLTAVGIALAVALGVAAGWVQAVWGLIPLFVGVAFLIYVPFYRKQRKEDEDR